MIRYGLFIVVTVALATLLGTADVFAQTGENVLVAVNDASSVSHRIGDYYAAKRAVTAANVIALTGLEADPNDTLTRSQYQTLIETPIADWFRRHAAHDRILYLVLTKGIPLRIQGTAGPRGTVASVVSELTLLYRKLSGRTVLAEGTVDYPYFLDAAPVDGADRFTHAQFDIFLVSRLDGFTVDDVLSMIDRGSSTVLDGRFVLEKKDASPHPGNTWLGEAATRLESNGSASAVKLDATTHVLREEPSVLGYYSWGSSDPGINRRHPGHQFLPGSLAAMYLSSDARTFREPPAEWEIGTWNDQETHFVGSPEWLVGDLIREGVSGAAGHVAEPTAGGTIRPQLLFPAYVSGFNLVASFYLAMPYLSWQTVVVGDPLCAPFSGARLTADLLDPGVDPVTELPRHFSERRLDIIRGTTRSTLAVLPINPDALKLLLRAEARTAREDDDGVRQALEAATEHEPRLTNAHLRLAVMYEQADDDANASARYRRVLALAPDNAVALNNLAYHLATRDGELSEALDFATRAYSVSRSDPTIADTLGWVHYLLGNDAEAATLLLEAVDGAGDNAEIRFHAAAVQARVGSFDAAAKELATALELDASLADRDDVRELQGRLRSVAAGL